MSRAPLLRVCRYAFAAVTAGNPLVKRAWKPLFARHAPAGQPKTPREASYSTNASPVFATDACTGGPADSGLSGRDDQVLADVDQAHIRDPVGLLDCGHGDAVAGGDGAEVLAPDHHVDLRRRGRRGSETGRRGGDARRGGRGRGLSLI